MINLKQIQDKINLVDSMEQKSEIFFNEILDDKDFKANDSNIREFCTKNSDIIEYIKFKKRKDNLIKQYSKVNTYHCIKDYEDIEKNTTLIGVCDKYKFKMNNYNNNLISNKHILFSEHRIIEIKDSKTFSEHFSLLLIQ